MYAFIYIKSFDVCQTYSTKKYTCVYTAVTRDEIDAALAAIVLKVHLKPSTDLLSHLVKRTAWHSPPQVKICVRLPPHRTRAGQRSVHGSVHPQSLPQSLPMIVDQEHDLHTITGVFN